MRKKLFRQLNRRRPEHNQLQVEHLESRMLLAGNVLASVVNGTLTLLGDDANNSVIVSTFYDSEYGDGFRVEGQDKDGKTEINGSCDPAEFFGVTNLNSDLIGGDDDFALTNDLDSLLSCLGITEPSPETANFISEDFYVPGWVVIQMGDGHNRVGVGSGEIGQRLLIQGGKDGDEVGICETKVGGNLVIQTFGGADDVFIHDSKTVGITRILTANGYSDVKIDGYCTQNLVVRGGNHGDTVCISCVDIGDDLVVQTFGGYDSVFIVECRDRREESVENFSEEGCYCEYDNYVGDMLLIQTGEGSSFVEVVSVSAGQMNILGGNDVDEIEIECVETYFDIRISTLDGCDIVDIDDLNVRSLIVDTGLGSDEVTVESEECANYFSEDLIIRTDGGDDVVIIGPEFFAIAATFEESREQSHIGDDLIIETGDGTDYIKVFDYCIGDDAVINAGAGDDSSYRYSDLSATSNGNDSQGGVELCDLKIGDVMTVLLGDGADSASINDVCVEGNAFVDAGAGDDGGGNRDGGNDEVGAQVSGGSNAGVWIRNLFVKKSFWLILGSGDDQASISDTHVLGSAYLNGNADDDEIGANGLDVSENLYVFLGTGDDVLFLDDCSATNARLYGGAGLNDGYYQGVNFFGSQKLYDFEFLVA